MMQSQGGVCARIAGCMTVCCLCAGTPGASPARQHPLVSCRLVSSRHILGRPCVCNCMWRCGASRVGGSAAVQRKRKKASPLTSGRTHQSTHWLWECAPPCSREPGRRCVVVVLLLTGSADHTFPACVSMHQCTILRCQPCCATYNSLYGCECVCVCVRPAARTAQRAHWQAG